jgi:hypothetical protein
MYMHLHKGSNISAEGPFGRKTNNTCSEFQDTPMIYGEAEEYLVVG